MPQQEWMHKAAGRCIDWLYSHATKTDIAEREMAEIIASEYEKAQGSMLANSIGELREAHAPATPAMSDEMKAHRRKAFAPDEVEAIEKEHELNDDFWGEDDDYCYCMLCGTPFNDGGGLYCSVACEDMADPLTF